MRLGGRHLGTPYAAIIFIMHSVLLNQRRDGLVLAKRQLPLLSRLSTGVYSERRYAKQYSTTCRLVPRDVLEKSRITSSWSSRRAPFLTLQRRHFLSGLMQALRAGGVEAVQDDDDRKQTSSPTTDLSQKLPERMLGTFPVSVCSIRGV